MKPSLRESVADAAARVELERAIVEKTIREVPPVEVLIQLVIRNAQARSEADVSLYLRTGLEIRRIIELLYAERVQVRSLVEEAGHAT